MNILVLGGAGQVGLALRELAWPPGISVHAPGRDDLDLFDSQAIQEAIGKESWGCVINSAAYTAVDKAETDVEAAWRINAVAPAVLAEATRKAGVPLVHVSTDYVFDGSKPDPYEVDDAVAPLGVYGASKEGGEQGVRTGNPRHAIIRTSWVVSPFRANFVKTMLRLAGERPMLRVVDDQRGTPTIAGELAAALAVIGLRLARDPASPTGTWHFANAGETSWCGLARETMSLSAARGGPNVPVEAIATADFPTPARRPLNSRLSTRQITSDFGIQPRDWRVALAEVVEQLVPAESKE